MSDDGGPYRVRRVRAQEWEAVRQIRLASLCDPLAHLAFLDSYEAAVARPAEFWRERAARAAQGDEVAQYVVVDQDGRWVGSVTGLLEPAGSVDFEGRAVARRQAHVVGVWLHPDHRGRGLIQRAIAAVVDWAGQQGAERARLYVHADNARARAAYLKAGFAPSGQVIAGTIGPEEELARPIG
ncbi:GNAT family N-acetyltransferase [Xylanimonas ulmi]|uniref:RimJ/RimL family protein N-acetyltransferase n=1 Tax=Xylanimonas ulmi TaxID=228973 RepID=A0A4Q7M508_9MICO|nr:GNAT family N-acetyltransferase [Xylanibacterium ulmi]RZS62694.1 RimJ/RimL family protein N-acetyltransferase [Xylanibacterium ulmi]